MGFGIDASRFSFTALLLDRLAVSAARHCLSGSNGSQRKSRALDPAIHS